MVKIIFGEPGIEKDRIKEDYFKSLGIQIIRFENKWVFEDIGWLLEQIRAKFNHPLIYNATH
jgi:very-short-patch-repair endonuclease